MPESVSQELLELWHDIDPYGYEDDVDDRDEAIERLRDEECAMQLIRNMRRALEEMI